MINNISKTYFRERILNTLIAYNTSNIRNILQRVLGIYEYNYKRNINRQELHQKRRLKWSDKIRNKTNYKRVNEGFMYGDKIRRGEMILDFAI